MVQRSKKTDLDNQTGPWKMDDMHLAFLTFSILKSPYGSWSSLQFDARTPDTFAEAEASLGFIDRARQIDPEPWTTNFQRNWGEWGPYAVPRFYLGGTTPGHDTEAQSLSVWKDLQSVWKFAYRGAFHRRALRDRYDWFGPQDWPIYCCWWVPDTRRPTWREACDRLEHLHDNGPTPTSFTLKSPFDAIDQPCKIS